MITAFKARAYGKKHAKVMFGKHEIMSQYAPSGSALQFCRKVAKAMNSLLDDAMYCRGKFVRRF